MKPVLVFICLFFLISHLSIRAKGFDHDIEKIIDEIKIGGGTKCNEENPQKICYATLIGKGSQLCLDHDEEDENSLGKFTLFGIKKNSKFDGKAFFSCNNGLTYMGEMKNNLLSGNGIMYFSRNHSI